MCNCSGSCSCSNSSILPVGPTGLSGRDGIYGGYSGEWLYSSTTTITPAAGQLRFNRNTANAVTNIFVSNMGDNSTPYSIFLASLTNAGDYGWVRIFKEYDSTKFWMGRITNVVSGGTYFNLTVSFNTASAGLIATSLFNNNDRIVLSFSPKGATGANGSAGAAGAPGAAGATGPQGPAGACECDCDGFYATISGQTNGLLLTCTPNGGIGPYTYSWVIAQNNNLPGTQGGTQTATTPTVAITNIVPVGPDGYGTNVHWSCIVTDDNGCVYIAYYMNITAAV